MTKQFNEITLPEMNLAGALSRLIDLTETTINQPDAPPEIIQVARLWVSSGTVTWRAQLAGERMLVDMTLSAKVRQGLNQALSEPPHSQESSAC